MLYIAIGILGATVMPHNLYLHSSIVQTRKYSDTAEGKRRSDPLRVDRLVGRADVRAVHQRRDPDHGRGDVPRHRPRGRRRHRRRLPAALAAARHDDGEHAVRGGAALLGTERHAHRHARRPDRDGRLHQPPPPPVAAAADHAAHRHHPGGHRRSRCTASAAPARCSS